MKSDAIKEHGRAAGQRSGRVNNIHVRISLCSLAWLEDPGVRLYDVALETLPTATLDH